MPVFSTPAPGSQGAVHSLFETGSLFFSSAEEHIWAGIANVMYLRLETSH